MIDVRGNNGLDMSETTNDNVIFKSFVVSLRQTLA